MKKGKAEALWFLAMYYVFFTIGYVLGNDVGSLTDFLFSTAIFLIGFIAAIYFT